jgi:hypothetical protein
MPTYEITFTDTSTLRVLSDSPANAKLHAEVLIRGGQDPALKGKAIANEPVKIKD